MTQLSLEGRITVFKSLAVSKNIRLLLIAKLHNNTINLLHKMHKKFIWQGKKHSSLKWVWKDRYKKC